MRQYQTPTITLEAAAQLTAGHVAGINATTGLAEACATEGALAVGVILESQDQAPYETTILAAGPVVDLITDGAGALAPGDPLTVGATAGQIKKRTPADGTTRRTLVGVCLATVAATQGLPVRAILTRCDYIGT